MKECKKEKIGWNFCTKCNKIWQVYIEKAGKKCCPKCNKEFEIIKIKEKVV